MAPDSKPFMIQKTRAFLRHARRPSLAALLLLSASLASAQTLTLSQALREALENNPGYLASRADRRFAENAHLSAGTAEYLPTLSASGAYNWSELDTRQERVTGNPPVSTTERVDGAQAVSRTLGVNANWTLFEGFSGPLAQKRLRLQREQARASERLTREQLLRRAALAYADLARQTRLREVRDTLYRLSEERFQILERRLASGSAARPAWLEGQVDRNADRAALVYQESVLHAARLALAAALGRDTAVAEQADDAALPAAPLDLPALNAGLEERQPALRLAEADRDLAQVTLRQYTSLWYPRLDAFVGYNWSLSSNDAGVVRENRSIGPSAGLQVTLNLFDGELPWNVYRRGRYAVSAAEHRLREARFAARSEVERAHAEWAALDSAAALEREGLGYARENLDLTYRRWKSGNLSYLEARLAQVKYFDAFTRAENSAFDAFRARLDLLRAAGRMELLLEESATP